MPLCAGGCATSTPTSTQTSGQRELYDVHGAELPRAHKWNVVGQRAAAAQALHAQEEYFFAGLANTGSNMNCIAA
ncbi:hypothetical protein B0H13DRAFT_2385303 [Mycena leptocephala]|nr:hypothetical protein B0H13DRAFT_2385303 [Mycena leptocephala]